MKIFGIIPLTSGLTIWALEQWVTGYTTIRSLLVVALVLIGLVMVTHPKGRS